MLKNVMHNVERVVWLLFWLLLAALFFAGAYTSSDGSGVMVFGLLGAGSVYGAWWRWNRKPPAEAGKPDPPKAD